MKAESTDQAPKFNLLKPDGVRAQGHADDVTHVLLNDGNWYAIAAGSFKFYKVGSDKGVPYVTFKIAQPPNQVTAKLIGKTVEVFPATVCGLAYGGDDEQ